MERILDVINGYFSEVPVWIPASAAVAAAVAVLAIVFVVKRKRLKSKADKMLASGVIDEEIRLKVLSRPGIIEYLMAKHGAQAVETLGAGEYLLHRFETGKKPEDAQRALSMAPDTAAFAVFSAGLKKKSVGKVFSTWMKDSDGLLRIRQLALSGRGKDFDGKAALGLLAGKAEEIRELSGDSEWAVRFFALRLLLADENEKSLRLIRESFNDPHPLIRTTIATEYSRTDMEFLFGSLMTLVLDDPVPEVRKAARKRIDGEFPDRWKLDPTGMNDLQSIHVLELLKTDSKEDENVAMNALKDSGPESMLAAARFLEKAGALNKLFLGADRGDREDWERRLKVLSNAVTVGIDGFLKVLSSTSDTGVLLLGARILKAGGDTRLISPLAEKAFNRPDPTRSSDEEELYRAAMSLSCTRGDETALKLVSTELRRRKGDSHTLGFILPLLPPESANIYKDVLSEFLLDDEDFESEDALLTILSDLPPRLFLGNVLDVLEGDRALYSHKIRLRAFRCLGSWRLDYALQQLLENLPILPKEYHAEFSGHLAALDRKPLESRISFLLSSPDARIRASVFSCLPEALAGGFKKEIDDGLSDADPGVRIACLKARLSTGGSLSETAMLKLLRDPVEKVRKESAAIIGELAGTKGLKSVAALVEDASESLPVRLSALKGIAENPNRETVGFLVSLLDTQEDLRTEIADCLSGMTGRTALMELLDQFKDARSAHRERLAEVFVAMGESGEEALVSLLREDIQSLKGFLADVLTRTGYVETQIRRLNHRSPKVRREAAEILADIATPSAYRGMVLAAKDPDKDVRIRVTRALEALASDDSLDILGKLSSDPDAKVRRYTQWALERIKAKRLP